MDDGSNHNCTGDPTDVNLGCARLESFTLGGDEEIKLGREFLAREIGLEPELTEEELDIMTSSELVEVWVQRYKVNASAERFQLILVHC